MGKTIQLLGVDGNSHPVLINADGEIVVRNGHDQAVMEGQIWYSSNFATLSGEGDTKYFYLNIPQVENQVYGENYFQLHMHWKIDADSGMILRTYVNPTVTAKGDPLVVRNKNGWFSGNPHYADFRVDAVFSDLGTEVWADIVGTEKSNEAGHGFAGEFILPGGLSYAMKIEKQASGDGWVSWHWYWSEEVVGINSVIPITTTSTTTTTTTV